MYGFVYVSLFASVYIDWLGTVRFGDDQEFVGHGAGGFHQKPGKIVVFL